MTNLTNLPCRLPCRLPCSLPCRLPCCPDIRSSVPGCGFGGATNVRVTLTNFTSITTRCPVGCPAANPRIHWAFALLVQPVVIFLLKVGRNKNWLCMVVRMYGFRVCIGFGEFLATGCTVPPKQHRWCAAKTISPVASGCWGLTFPKGPVMETELPLYPTNAGPLNQLRLCGLTKPGATP